MAHTNPGASSDNRPSQAEVAPDPRQVPHFGPGGDDIHDSEAEWQAWIPAEFRADFAHLLAPTTEPLVESQGRRWSLIESFDRWDADANHMQRRHILFVRVAGITAVLAVVLAVLQLPLADWLRLGISEWPVFQLVANSGPFHGPTGLLEAVEIVSAVLAFVSVVIGLIAAWSQKWQVRRLQAEQCRFLKFGYLLRCASSPAEARQFLVQGLTRLHALDMPAERAALRTAAKRWVRRDLELVNVDDFDPRSSGSPTVPLIIAYFLRKRIRYQAEYFHRQAEIREQMESFSKWFPVSLFFLSLIAAIAHFVVPRLLGHHAEPSTEAIHAVADLAGSEPGVTHGHTTYHSNLELSFLLIAACLPAIGAGIRTYRAALEFGRNANRFHGTWIQLRHYEAALHDRLKNQQVDGQLRVLRDVEMTLEDENRSWTRLMVEAEWFG